MVTVSGTPDIASLGVAFTIQVSDSAHHTAPQPYNVSILLQADTMITSSASFDFGNQIVGSASDAQTEALTNTGTADILIGGITIAATAATAGEFKQISTTCGASLAPQASCEVSVTFTPGQPGPRTAVLTVTYDTVGSPQSVGLTGIGLTAGPNATLSSPNLLFTTQLVPTKSPPRMLNLTNYGAIALTIGSVTSGSNFFAETNNCGGSLASGATCTIAVTFTPAVPGTVNGTLSIADDTADTPQTVSLSGSGSTTTPLLTGYCYSTCKKEVKVPACPAGEMSQTPENAGNPCGVFGNPGIPVDYGRPCAIPPGSFQDKGYCVTDRPY
jgi:hypothetical protein